MMMQAHSHLSDDQLIELCLAGDPLGGGHACAACEARHAELSALLRDVSGAATQDADAAFPPERLARQQARILQRLEQDGRPGRLLAFRGHLPEAVSLRGRPSSRWIAAAAAAGLVIGLLAGHLAHDIPNRLAGPAAPLAARATDAAPTGTLRAVATTFSEDEFLDQIDSIAESPGGDALRAMHDVTPRAWEVK